MHGKGCFFYNTGVYIEGEFTEGLTNGEACIQYPNGSYLKGRFQEGKLIDRALYYNSIEDKWTLKDYRLGDVPFIFCEGKGNPISYGN